MSDKAGRQRKVREINNKNLKKICHYVKTYDILEAAIVCAAAGGIIGSEKVKAYE